MSKDLLPSLIRSAGAIVINSNGQRIFNELDLSKHMTSALFQNCNHHSVRLTSGREQHVAYVLINREVTSHIGNDAATILQHEQAGKSYGEINHFCEEYKIPTEELQKTFENYERYCHHHCLISLIASSLSHSNIGLLLLVLMNLVKRSFQFHTLV